MKNDESTRPKKRVSKSSLAVTFVYSITILGVVFLAFVKSCGAVQHRPPVNAHNQQNQQVVQQNAMPEGSTLENANVEGANEPYTLPEFTEEHCRMSWSTRSFTARKLANDDNQISFLFGELLNADDSILQTQFQDVFGQILRHVNQIHIGLLIEAAVEVLKNNPTFIEAYSAPVSVFDLARERNVDGELTYDVLNRFLDCPSDEGYCCSSDEEEHEKRESLNTLRGEERQITCSESARNTVYFKSTYLEPSEQKQERFLQKRAERLGIQFQNNCSPLQKTVLVIQAEVSRKQQQDLNSEAPITQYRLNDLENIPMVRD